MQDEQKQIAEMAKNLCEGYGTDFCKKECQLLGECFDECSAKALYAAGYRKQSDTAREVIMKVLSIIQNEYEYYPDGMTLGTYAQLCKEINELTAQYGVEVEE